MESFGGGGGGVTLLAATFVEMAMRMCTLSEEDGENAKSTLEYDPLQHEIEVKPLLDMSDATHLAKPESQTGEGEQEVLLVQPISESND